MATLFIAMAMMVGAVHAQAQTVDWVVNITDAGSDPTAAGGTVSYVMNVANNGTGPAPATTINLTVPAGTTLTGTTGTITGCTPVPSVGPSVVVCNVPALASAASVDLTASVLTTTAGGINFLASVPVGADIDTLNNGVTETTTITAGADISLGLTGPATAASGSIITYVYTATNNGPDSATNVVLQFPVPTGITNVTPPVGCTLAASTYSCTIAGPIANGASVTRSFLGQVSAASGSTVSAVGSVSGGTPVDPVSLNNSANLNTTVTAGSDLTITKVRSPSGALLVGGTASFTLTPSYTGDSPNGIVVSDTIPSNYAITGVTAPGWLCTFPAQVVNCTKATGSGAGAQVPLGPITVATNIISVGTPTNTATISSSSPADPVPSNNTANDGGATINAPVVDLRANKSGPSPALVVVGNSYDFSISTSNIGNTGFFGTLQMTDNLPAGLTYTGATLNGWTCLPAAPVVGPATISCSRIYTAGAPLAPLATTPAVILTTTATSAGSISNSLTVGSPNSNVIDTNLPNNTITYGVTGSTGANSADVSVVKTASVATLAAGDIETFSIEVRNTGPVTAANVSLTDSLNNLMNSSTGPTGSGFISATVVPNLASGVSCAATPNGGATVQLNCSIASLPVCVAGSTCPVFTVAVRPGGDAGGRSNTADVISSTTADNNLGNNSSSAPYTILGRADVTVSKVANPTPAVAGQNLTYVITATNIANGLSSADAVTITDTLPSNVTFVSATPSSGSCATAPAANSVTGVGNNSLICNLGTIGNGSQQTVTVVVRPNLVTRGTTLHNDVSVTTTTTEINAGNNAASTDTPVLEPSIDLLINKDDTVDPLAIGDNTVYLVTVTNLGPSAAENVVVTDTMPTTRVEYVSHVLPADGSCSSVPAANSLGGTLTCSFPVIPAGQSRVLQITARGVAKGSTINTASLTSSETGLGFEANTGNNTSSENTSVRTKADVQIVSKIATPATVNIRDTFNYEIIVRNNTGAGRSEADDVVVSDTLPSGMVLVGTPTVAVPVGTTTLSSCTGVQGATSFSCSLGTMSLGGEVRITMPVRVVSISFSGQTFTNTASVSTSSFDEVPGNNSNSGSVVVNASSISGRVFRDFANDGTFTGSDTGISGITMTMNVTPVVGLPFVLTSTTDGVGNFSFGRLPQGTYTLTQGAIAETFLSNGTTSAGSSGGTVAPTVISSIALAGGTNATNYLFPKVPQARVAIAKQVLSGPTLNSDGTFTVSFRLNVRNLSLEALDTIVVSDPLQGGAPLFGTYTAASPTVSGTYTVLAAPTGSCGGLNAGFDGAGNPVAASGFGLSQLGSCTVDLQLRVLPSNPMPPVLAGGERYRNQATVDARGVLSGQTSATNPQLTDLSDDGATTDADGDGMGNEAGENDPTPITVNVASSISLIKSLTSVVDTTADGLIGAGDTANYSFAVTNTGGTALSNITVTDPLLAVVGGPISLAVGATNSAAFTGSYTLLQADIDRGYLENTATANGNAVAPDGAPFLDDAGSPVTVTDVSDTGTNPSGAAISNPETVETANGTGVTDGNATNDPTVSTFAPTARIELVKSLVAVTDTTGDGVIGAGDTASYAFSVTNRGTVALANVSITDPLVAVSGGPVSLAIGATNSTAFTAAYVLQQADVDRGYVENTATATGDAVTSTGTPILSGGLQLTTSDVSDTGTNPDGSTVAVPIVTETPDGTGATDLDPTNDPTVAVIVPGPRIQLEKRLISVVDTNTDGLRNAGDTANYGFTVRNTGALALVNVTVSDPLVTVAGGPIALLAVGATDSTTYTASYVIQQADVDAGFFDNTASVTGAAATTAGVPILDGLGAPITTSDISDTATAPDGSAVAAPASTETASGAGVSDLDPTNDPTSLALGPVASISLIKSLVSVNDTNADGQIGAGDTASYAFTVSNVGNVALVGVSVTDPQFTVAGGPVDLAIAATDSASFTGTYTILQADVDRGYMENTATATGAAVTSGGVPILDVLGNPVTATDTSDSGTNPGGAAISNPETVETPDGTGTTDGNGTNDPTVSTLAPTPRIVLLKSLVAVTDTNGDGLIGANDTATYGFSVTNTGTVALANVSITDPLVAVSGGPVSLAIGATNSTAFTAAYVLQQADVDRGYVENTATATGDAVTSTGTPILSGGLQVTTSDVSDTGTNSDGSAVATPASSETPDGTGATDLDPTNDPTVAIMNRDPRMRLIKRVAGTTDVNANGFVDLGDIVNYSFAVTNTGNVQLAGVTVSDALAAVAGGPISLAVGQTDATSFTASYTLTAADITRSYVENTATADGNAVSLGGVPLLDGANNPIVVSDVSDSGTNPDGTPITDPDGTETPDGTGATDSNSSNDPTVLTVGRPAIQLDIAILNIPDTNGNGIVDAGDRINYSFTVTNTGDVALTNVNMDPASISILLNGLSCAPISLAVGETQTLVCTGNSHTITAADVAAGTVTLSGTATGVSPSARVVSDDDAVVSPVLGLGGLTITKTVDRGQASPGDVISYTITVTNGSPDLTTSPDIVDVLPAGFIYQAGTATVAGVAQEPAIAGRTMTWTGISLAPGGSVVVVLDVLISASASPGSHDNHARGVNPQTGVAVTQDAIATVRVAAEPVFACATVIGRVFDDLNQDGYFNDEPKESRSVLTDQTYHADKFGSVADAADETGIAGVRLVAPNGLAITTDAHGRFSVPCAALPADIGSNFMLKIDTRTLPAGYRLTTENPRVVRVTPGMLTKMNFGATISRVVRVELSARAFGPDASTTPRDELVSGLKKMVADIASKPSMLRLSYQLGKGESQKLAKQRLQAVEKLLRKLWPANGRYQLNVETVIQRRVAKAVNE